MSRLIQLQCSYRSTSRSRSAKRTLRTCLGHLFHWKSEFESRIRWGAAPLVHLRSTVKLLGLRGRFRSTQGQFDGNGQICPWEGSHMSMSPSWDPHIRKKASSSFAELACTTDRRSAHGGGARTARQARGGRARTARVLVAVAREELAAAGHGGSRLVERGGGARQGEDNFKGGGRNLAGRARGRPWWVRPRRGCTRPAMVGTARLRARIPCDRSRAGARSSEEVVGGGAPCRTGRATTDKATTWYGPHGCGHGGQSRGGEALRGWRHARGRGRS